MTHMIVLTRNNESRNWIATSENHGHTTKGSTPESAVRRMHIADPTTSDHEIRFVMNETARTHIKRNYDVCAICQKPLTWVRARDGNRVLIQAIHEGDPIPNDAVFGTFIANSTKKRVLGKTPCTTPATTTPPVIDVTPTLPVVDITCLKRNRFVIVGKIIEKMVENGATKEQTDAARTDMLTGGMNFEHFVDVASNYAALHDMH